MPTPTQSQARGRIRQRQASSSSSSSSASSSSCSLEDDRMTNVTTNVYSTIRQEYIDAVFGQDFFPLRSNDYVPPRQGMGQAQVPSFVTYQATIPPPPIPFGGVHLPLEQKQNPKLGLTLTKLSLGLYVQWLDNNSEAALAGVRVGSILVAVNGMGMLVEPSRHALERLWQYEGLFESSGTSGTTEDEDVASTGSNGTSNPITNNNNSQQRPKMQQPVALTFLKDGRLYTALLLAKNYGIQWASCGNFCLVNRAYSYASSLGGVRRGSILASVNGISLRASEDYTLLGETLRQVFQDRQEPLKLWLVYTPEAGRTGFWERRMNLQQQAQIQTGDKTTDETTTTAGCTIATVPNKKKSFTEKRNGVAIRVHSLEESWTSLWGNNNNCNSRCGPITKAWSTVTGGYGTAEGQSPMGNANNNDDLVGSVAELANQVVEGQTIAPTTPTTKYHWSRHQRIFGPCPVLHPTELLRLWDPLQAIMYCLRSYQHLLELSSTTHDNNHGEPSLPPHNDLLGDEETTALLKQLATEDMIQTFLWQFISLIASYHPMSKKEEAVIPQTTTVAANENVNINSMWMEEKKDEVPDNNNPPVPSQPHFATTGEYNYGDVLTSLLLKLSRKDQDFCQRLYFCLRSTLDYATPPENNNHLLALFNCLKLLRSAEREALDGGNLGGVEQQYLNNTSTITTADNTATKNLNTNEVDGSMDLSLTSSQKAEKRRLFGFFRKSKSKNKKKHQPPVVVMETAPSPKKQPLSRPLSPRRMISSAPQVLTAAAKTTATMPLLENMSEFIKELDGICTSIEKRLLKSMSQKIADWALQPWSASKSSVLNTLTEGMRQSLEAHSGTTASRKPPKPFCLVNPLGSNELLVGVDPQQCYILPSAHFPLLLTFDATERQQMASTPSPQPNPSLLQRGRERSYRIVVEICNLAASASRLVLHGAIGGVIQESASTLQQLQQNGRASHSFRQKLQFDTRSSWGAPRTLSLRLSSAPDDKDSSDRNGTISDNPSGDGGFGWIDLVPLWDRLERFQERESYCTAKIYAMGDHGFDEQGSFLSTNSSGERLRPVRLEFKVTTEVIDDRIQGQPAMPLHKRMLLYKHDEDLRQEAFAIQFVKTCDTILKASGLDLKLLTFGCIPVGANRGFIEWIEGSVPLSDICQRPYSFFGTTSTATASNNSDKEEGQEEGSDEDGGGDDEDDMSMVAKAGMTNYESLYRMGIMAGVGNAAATAMKNTRSSHQLSQQLGPRGSLANNPIQDFLRSIAFDAEAPYFVCGEVMDTYVKSCAGYCVITYLLGVGDRHLDNLLLHNQTGCFFHCDYSFLFGNDPKKYLPMRVTEDMIYGMGGRESDNYVKFLSLTGCAFVAFRRPENVRLLLSLVRVMEAARLPDLIPSGSSDSVADVVLGLRERLRLDLTDEQGVAYLEEMVESSLSSKLWMAVDAIHSLGKRF